MIASCAAFAEYPAPVEGIDLGGATISIYDYWTANADRVADPDDETAALYDIRCRYKLAFFKVRRIYI